MRSQPELSVVLCSLNGAAGVARCLSALRQQTIADSLELIVVDDGSTDDTAATAATAGATVVRHAVNHGLAAARNSGIVVSQAPIVAFLDDDCIPEPEWAERLLAGYVDESVAGVGGAVVPRAGGGLVGSYLERHNPLAPLEQELARSERLGYRLRLYLKRQWSRQQRPMRRTVYCLVGANMSLRRTVLIDVGLFDPRFRFGAEELDLARRVHSRLPGHRLIVDDTARVEHFFQPVLGDVLRRSRAYGRGSARMFVKWPSVRPTVFPLPLVVAALVTAGLWRRVWLVAATFVPIAAVPRAARDAAASRRGRLLLDAYIQLAQETAENVGFASGWLRYRKLDWLTDEAKTPVPAVMDDLSEAA